MKIDRVRIPILLGLLLLGAPQASQAQLFPNLPIQRQRTPCEAEAPVFQQYRHVYHGYHPTCWRRFKPGWGCPSPEAPNVAAEYKKLPLSRPEGDEEPTKDDAGAGTDSRKEGEEPGEMPLPTLPRTDRSPFDLDPATGPEAAPTRPPTPAGLRGTRPNDSSMLSPRPLINPSSRAVITTSIANSNEEGLPPLPDDVETTSSVVVSQDPPPAPPTAAVPYPMPRGAAPVLITRGPDLHIRGSFPSTPAQVAHAQGMVQHPTGTDPSKRRPSLLNSLFRGRSGKP